MKKVLKFFLKIYLKYLTKLTIAIHRPLIIGISGSVNKYFVKEEVKNALMSKDYKVRSAPKNFNTEIGLPLSVLYLPSGYNSYKAWLPIIFKAIPAIWKKDFPKILILELGASEPGDMKYLLTVIKPQIAIITDITQRYVESFSDMDELVGEYEKLIAKLGNSGLLIFNNDNNRIATIASRAKCEAVSIGSTEDADWQITNLNTVEDGQEVIVKNKNETKQYKINKFGKHHVFSLIAGIVIKNYVEL